jgi:hypothetical protein
VPGLTFSAPLSPHLISERGVESETKTDWNRKWVW